MSDTGTVIFALIVVSCLLQLLFPFLFSVSSLAKQNLPSSFHSLVVSDLGVVRRIGLSILVLRRLVSANVPATAALYPLPVKPQRYILVSRNVRLGLVLHVVSRLFCSFVKFIFQQAAFYFAVVEYHTARSF